MHEKNLPLSTACTSLSSTATGLDVKDKEICGVWEARENTPERRKLLQVYKFHYAHGGQLHCLQKCCGDSVADMLEQQGITGRVQFYISRAISSTVLESVLEPTIL